MITNGHFTITRGTHLVSPLINRLIARAHHLNEWAIAYVLRMSVTPRGPTPLINGLQPESESDTQASYTCRHVLNNAL